MTIPSWAIPFTKKINDELFYKISVENLVGHPIFSFTKNTIKGSSHSKSEEITSWGWSLELSSLLICLPIVCVDFFPLYLFQRFDVELKCVIIVYTKVRRNTTLLAWDLVLTIKIDLEQVIKKLLSISLQRKIYRSNVGMWLRSFTILSKFAF